jgi:thiamine pyrophosphate-dependent acetolactate synthase large subunit-like protein
MAQLPVVAVVFNNQCWNAGRDRSWTSPYLGGTAETFLCDLEPSPAYEKIAEAFGGYGERVRTRTRSFRR